MCDRDISRSIVLCFGLPRSGSTLQFNIVNMLSKSVGWNVLEWQKKSRLVRSVLNADPTVDMVLKTHDASDITTLSNTRYRVVTTIRDFRDVAASNKLAFDNPVAKTVKDLRRSLNQIDKMSAMSEFRLYFTSYKSMTSSISKETSKIADFLDISVTQEQCNAIDTMLNVQAVKDDSKSNITGKSSFLRRAKLFIGIAPYANKELRLHPKHISEFNGESNYYEAVLNTKEIRFIENEMEEYFSKYSDLI